MAAQLYSPTQERASRLRCPHGYYLEYRKLHTPPCQHCHPLAYGLEKELASYALAILAFRKPKPRNDVSGRFEVVIARTEGERTCWCCKESKPLTSEHWRKASSKKTGFQTRCKRCENHLRNLRRRGLSRPGVMALIEVGAL